jgi:hypothetical protein
MKIILTSLSFICCLTVFSQEIKLYSTIYFPACPAGGKKELQEFIKHELVYPTKAKINTIEGNVFITFKVNSNGLVVFREADTISNILLREEAIRVFDKIIWEKDQGRESKNLGFEKVEFVFKLKKYEKLIKKRGYDMLPNSDHFDIHEASVYPLNLVDEHPEISNAPSINDFLRVNFKYPAIALQRNVSGRVTAEFVIEPYGVATNIRIIEPLAGGCNEETMRLINLMEWTAGKKNGEAVRTLYRYQLNFVNTGGQIR